MELAVIYMNISGTVKCWLQLAVIYCTRRTLQHLQCGCSPCSRKAGAAERMLSVLRFLVLLGAQMHLVTGYGTMSTISAMGERYLNSSDGLINRDPRTNTYAICALQAETFTPLCGGTFPYRNNTQAPENTPLYALVNGYYFTCGLRYNERTPVCWGDQQVPARFADSTYTELSAGGFHVCGLKSSGSVDCWGSNESNQSQPVNTEPLVSLTSGRYFTCGLKGNGQATCWGNPLAGEYSEPPSQRFDAIFAGGYHVCGILSVSKKALCWGGSSIYNETLAPQDVTFSTIVGGLYHSCGLASDTGQAICWGDNAFEQRQAPPKVAFSTLSASGFYTCGVRLKDQRMQCWGNYIDTDSIGLDVRFSPGLCTTKGCSKNRRSSENKCLSIREKICLIVPPVANTPGLAPIPAVAGQQIIVHRSSMMGLILGAVGGALALASISIITVFICVLCSRRGKTWWQALEKELPDTSIVTIFSAVELRAATQGYSDTMVIGRGTFGTVYRGVLSSGQVVAIKRSDGESSRDKTFVNEIDLLARLNHTCLVKLLGFCDEELLLVYEFMEHGSLFDCLFNKPHYVLDWPSRLKIALQVARGLEHLHCFVSPRLVHRDVKSANILLDRDQNAHISDFGLSHSGPSLNMTHLSNVSVVGTPGYLDPEYYLTSQLTTRSDVYSFGVVLMELVTGRKCIGENGSSIVPWVTGFVRRGAVSEIVDSRLSPFRDLEDMTRVLALALQCTMFERRHRPDMTEIVALLEGLHRGSSMFLSISSSKCSFNTDASG